MQTVNSPKPPKTTFYILVLVILLNLAKLWFFKYFPSADGAAHIELAAVTRSLLSGNCPGISKIFTFTPTIVPTWIANFILVPLLAIFPAFIAEKILVSIYIILFPLCLYPLFRKINPNSIVLLLAACLFLPNYTYYSGNYNFILSFLFYLYSINWFITHRHKPNIIFFTILFFLNYLFHLFGFLAFCLSIFIIHSSDFKNLRTYLNKGLLALACALPTFAIFIHYLSLPRIPIGGESSAYLHLLHIIAPTIIFTGFDFTYATIIIANIYFLFTITFLAYKNRSTKNPYNFFLWLAVTFTLLTLILPGGFGGGSGFGPRLQLYIYIFLLLWPARFNLAPRTSTILTIILTTALIYQNLASYPYFAAYNKLAAHIETAEKIIPNNSTIYSANLSPDLPPGRIGYFKMSGYITADKSCIINTSSYALSEKNTFPVAFKDQYNPNYHLGSFRDPKSKMLNPPIADFEKYQAETGVNIDFVSIMGDKPNLLKTQNSFRPFYQSADGILKIYERTDRTDN